MFAVISAISAFAFQEILGAWRSAVARLVKRGVTGRILIGNMPSLKGLPVRVHIYTRGKRELLVKLVAAEPMRRF